MLDNIGFDLLFTSKRIRFIGYRFDATGVFGYRYCSTTTDKFCTVSSIAAPSSPVMIHGNDVTWKSDFDSFKTIFPGDTRYVNDELTGTNLFRIVYKDIGKYEINNSIVVYCDTGKYTFCCDNKVIATITRLSGKSGHIKKPLDNYYNYEPYFEVTADDKIDTELLMVILAFPMLQFAF